MLKGIAASQGVAIAKVYKLQQPVLNIVKKDADPEQELAKLDKAFQKTVDDITKIKERAAKTLAPDELAIFDAHLMMAQDPDLRSQIEEMIKGDKVNAEYAADVVASNTVQMFESLEDAYMRDLSDIRPYLEQAKTFQPREYASNTGHMISLIEDWIDTH